MIRQAIREKIAGVPLVAELCTDPKDQSVRVFWQRQESGEDVPCIVFLLVGGTYAQMTSCGPSGPHEITMAFYAASEDAEQAVALEAAVVAALHGARWTANETNVQMCRFTERVQDDYDDNEASSLYMCGSAAVLTYTDN